MKNPIKRGRMYKVSGGGAVRGIRFNKNGTTDVLVVPGGRRRNPKKKKKTRKGKERNPYYNVGGKTVKARSRKRAHESKKKKK